MVSSGGIADKQPVPDVPENLRAKLSEPIKVGDLEVVPLRVEVRRTTRYRKLAGQPPGERKLDQPLLMLYLKIKNNSEDVYLCPTDPAFARRRVSTPDILPFTGLAFGENKEKRFVPGGAFLWPDNDFEFEIVEVMLGDDVKSPFPRSGCTYIITADMDNTTIKKELENARQKKLPIVWQVQLRRGLETVKDGSGNQRDISLSSVIGVMLTGDDFPF